MDKVFYIGFYDTNENALYPQEAYLAKGKEFDEKSKIYGISFIV